LSPFVPLTRERALESARCFRIVATKKPKGGARWRYRAEEDEEEENEMEGEYDDPTFATHGENIRVHTFLWSDGQMTMVPWWAQPKEIKVLAVCVCACATPTQCPAFRGLKEYRSCGTSRVYIQAAQGLHSYRGLASKCSRLDFSTEHLPTQISISSRNRYPKHRRHKTGITEENTRLDLDQDRRSADFYRSFLKPSREDQGGVVD
jgi:hypothetical protein